MMLGWHHVVRLSLVGGLFCILSAGPAEAVRFVQASDFVHPAHEVESDEVWVAADSILIDGRMNQSFFGLAKQAELDGFFAQDVWLAANQIGGRPNVAQNIRMAASRHIQFNGHAAGNVMAISADMIRLGPQSRVEGNVLLVAPIVILEGTILGDAQVRASQVIVSGRVQGSVNARTAHLDLAPGAFIEGDVRHTAARDPVFDSSVRIRGSLTRSDESEPIMIRREWAALGWLGQIYLYAAAVLAGLLFLGLFPSYAGRSVRMVRRSFWKSLLSGAIWLVLIPLGTLFLAVTVIGLPVALVVGLLFGILLYVSKVVVAVALGSVLLRLQGVQTFGRAIAALLLGMLFLYLGANLPMIGAWITWFILLTGLGALLLGLGPARAPAVAPPPVPVSETNQDQTTESVT